MDAEMFFLWLGYKLECFVVGLTSHPSKADYEIGKLYDKYYEDKCAILEKRRLAKETESKS